MNLTQLRAFHMVARESAPAPLAYPRWLGHWPAVAGVVAFVWLELIYGASGSSVGLRPEIVAQATLLYSAITFVAMALFGVERWIEQGEAFSVYFRMFSTLSPFEVRDGRLGVRRPLSGATKWGQVPGSLALVLTTIGATSYDGSTEGALASPITETFEVFRDLGLGLVGAFRLNGTLWMFIVIGAAALLFMLGIRGMHTVKGSPPVRELARSFAHTLIPIALAYLVAHYFTLFVYQEQAQFTYLLSDPLGDGSDLFGTAGGSVDYGVIGTTGVWYTQVAALVIGHVAALTLAHDRALAIRPDLPQVVIGLAVIVLFFSFKADNFFTAPNFINIITQMAGVTMLAYGVVLGGMPITLTPPPRATSMDQIISWYFTFGSPFTNRIFSGRGS